MILIINCGSSKTPRFSEVLTSLGVESKIVSLKDLISSDYNNIDGLIISGAPILLTEVDPLPYLAKLNFVLDLTIPVLGVCFGHQIIGMLNDAKASRCEEDRSWQNINLIDESRLFGNMDSCKMMEDHCECISLPINFKLLGSSEVCEVEAMEHISKNIFGVQFHPEVSGEDGKTLLKNFCELCTK